jgi:DNA-directed RNA polymerase subunit RPC12/RpoP
MYIEFGMAHKYVNDLGKNTKRGLTSKAEKGWFPSVAPLGYSNSKVEARGNKTILCDPDRFDAVRRMWDLMLSGNYSPARIQHIANNEWGFRTPRTKLGGGNPLSRSVIYKMFTNPFYYGRYEYPKGSGNSYDGLHIPMITEAEFERVQWLLHRDTNPRPQTEYDLPLRGLIKCGECGSSITAQFKEQVRCTQCRFKSSVKNRGTCGKCGLAISDMNKPVIRRYAYYHCTRTLNPLCRQKCVSSTALEAQLIEKLKAFGLASDLRDWGLKCIDGLREQELADKQQLIAERKKAYDHCLMRLENLVKLKTAPENADNGLLSDEEYQKQRTDLLAEKSRLAIDSSAFESEVNEKAQCIKEALEVMADLEKLTPDANTLRRREVLSALGSNHVLKEKKLEIKPEFPFSEFPRDGKDDGQDFTPIEPENNQGGQGANALIPSPYPLLERGVDDSRTNLLRACLKSVWKEKKRWIPIFKRKSLRPRPEDFLPLRRRGRFISRRDVDLS